MYNGERFLPATLDSVLGQTFGDFEVIISDNASTDGTADICNSYGRRDKRIRYYRNEVNLGGGWNHNRALELATAEYFKWAASDDICAPEFLETCVKALDENPAAVLSHPKTRLIDTSGKVIEDYTLDLDTESDVPGRRFRDLVMSYHMCYQIYGVIRRNVLHKTGPMPNCVNGDGILLAHIALFGPYVKIPDFLFFSRRHPAQSSQTLPRRLSTRRFRLTGRINGMPCMEWWDTSKKRHLAFPQWRQLRDFSRCIVHSPLGWHDRRDCYSVLARWAYRDRKRYVKDLLIAADQIVDNILANEREPVKTQHIGGGVA